MESEEAKALFVNGVEAATRTGLRAKRRLLAREISAAVLARRREGGREHAHRASVEGVGRASLSRHGTNAAGRGPGQTVRGR